MDCIYCNAEILDIASSSCPNCHAKNPMSKRPVEITPEYELKLHRLKREKMPDKLVDEGTPVQLTPGIGLIVGIISALLMGLFCYYIFNHFGMGKPSSSKIEAPLEDLQFPKKEK